MYCLVRDELLQMKNYWNSFQRIEVCLKFSKSMDHRNPLRLPLRNGWRNFLEIRWSRIKDWHVNISFQVCRKAHLSQNELFRSLFSLRNQLSSVTFLDYG